MIIIHFFKDLIFYIKYKFNEKKFSIGFFCENKFILNYLSPYIKNKSKNNRPILIISLEEIKHSFNKNIIIYIFHTNFFREIFFLTLKLKYLYSSTPDLENTIFKKTKFSNCKYIYIQHSPVSLNLIYKDGAFDNFDAIQTISKFQNMEIKEIIKKRNIKLKVFKSKYLYIKKIEVTSVTAEKIDLLVAPSWNTSFYKLNCHKKLHDHLIKNSINYKLRPHPMSFKRNEITTYELNKAGIKIDNTKLINFNSFNLLISDWSGIFIEYALLSNQKAFLIDTPKKIKNKNYERYKSQPIEIAMRDKFGQTYGVNNIEILVKDILNLKEKKLYEDESLKKFIKDNFF